MAERSRGRPPKYPADEVRLRLLEAGREVVLRHGPGCGLDPVTLDGAIAEADVPRGSAYRLWQDDVLTPQQAYRQAVQIDLLRRAGDGVPEATAKFKETYDEFAEFSQSQDPDERKWAFRTIMRIVANHSYERLFESRKWRVYQALRSNVVAKASPRAEAIEVIRHAEAVQIEAYAEMYSEIAKVYGIRIREPYTMHEFATSAFALNEGIASRVTDGFRRHVERPTGRHGEDEEWTLFAIGLEALADHYFEPVESAA